MAEVPWAPRCPRRLLTAALLAATFAPEASSAPPRVELLVPVDSIPAGQVRLSSGNWWAFSLNGNGVVYPRSIRVHIREPQCLPSPPCDEEEQKAPVSFQPAEPLPTFLVRGLYFDSKRAIPTVTSVPPQKLTTIGQKLPLVLRQTTSTLETIGVPGPTPDDPPSAFSILLRQGDRSQILWDLKRDASTIWDDPALSIIWAGDLDGDQRLDLLMVLAAKYTLWPHVLFLSGHAAPHEIVGRAGEFTIGD